MSEETVAIVRQGFKAFSENDFAHAFKLQDGKVVEWRMFGPVSEALQALGVEE